MSHPEGNSDFAIHNHKEIVFILEDMAKQREAIKLTTPDGVSFLSLVLKVVPAANNVYVEVSPDNRVNDKVTNSKQVNFCTQGGVKVRWHSTHLRLVSLPDGDAFCMTLPAEIERIQRRAYFRLNSPQGSNAMVCKIPSEEGCIEAVIMNMSAEGINISIKGELPQDFSQGAILEGCSIEFPGIGVVPLKLKFCGVWSSIKTKSGEQVHRIGIQFVNLSRGASNVIQRHMIQLEKDLLNKT